jgi:hypothetical protein
MGMPKAGCGRSDGAAFSGEVVEVDIGLPAAVHRAFLR